MKISIHMKSGKTLTERFIKDINLEYNKSNGKITSLTLVKKRGFNWSRVIFMGALVLCEIEAITTG